MMKGKGKRRVMPAAAVAIALVVLACCAASAQPQIVVTISDLIQMSAEPASVAADGESTSEITIVVFYPELEDYPELGEVEGYEILSGTPAANTPVIVGTTYGELTDAEDVNSTGTNITVYTGTNGTATVFLSGSETGEADITARARSVENMINDYVANETTVYIVKTSTAVTFLEPSGNGGNGGSPATTPTSSPSPAETPGVNVTPAVSPTPSVITTPAITPAASPAETPAPSAAPTPATSPAGRIPGFEAVFAIAGLLAVAYLALRRERKA